MIKYRCPFWINRGVLILLKLTKTEFDLRVATSDVLTFLGDYYAAQSVVLRKFVADNPYASLTYRRNGALTYTPAVTVYYEGDVLVVADIFDPQSHNPDDLLFFLLEREGKDWRIGNRILRGDPQNASTYREQAEILRQLLGG